MPLTWNRGPGAADAMPAASVERTPLAWVRCSSISSSAPAPVADRPQLGVHRGDRPEQVQRLVDQVRPEVQQRAAALARRCPPCQLPLTGSEPVDPGGEAVHRRRARRRRSAGAAVSRSLSQRRFWYGVMTRPTPVGVVDQLLRVGRGQRERFVDDDVQAEVQRLVRQRGMGGGRCGDRHAPRRPVRAARASAPTGVAPGSSARTCACRSAEPVTTATSSNPVGGRDQRLVEGPAAGAVPGQRPAKRWTPSSVLIRPSCRRADRRRRMWGCRTPRLAWCNVTDHLIVRGAREHNLRNVDITLPRDSLVVFTGLSGSGKSSLAFDTIFAEGQRRYVESLSSYARQFLGQMDKPDVDFIEGLSPAVSIDQKSTSRNPRSTVGTITEIYDYLRLLYARIGHPHCPICGEPISKQTPQQIVDRVLEMPEGTRFQVLAPVIRERKGEYVDLFADLQSKGYSRARIDGVVHPLTEPPKLKKQEKHSIEVVVDRLVNRATAKQRITDSVETGLGLADGVVILDFVDLDEDDPLRERRYSERLACPNDHPLALDELEPRSFSFNSPFGACPECTGLGTRKEVDPELVVPDGAASLGGGAIHPWSAGTTSEYFTRLLQGLARGDGLLHGHRLGQAAARRSARRCCTASTNRCTSPTATGTTGSGRTTPSSRASSRTWNAARRRRIPTSPGRSTRATCGRCRARSCHGTRLKPEILAVTIEHAELGRQNIAELSAMSIKDAAAFFPGLDAVRAGPDDRRTGAQGGRRPARVPARRRAGLPVAEPAGGHPVRRRGAADPAGHPDRLRAGRRAVRAGRAVDRAAPAGQPPADPDPDPAARSRATR